MAAIAVGERKNGSALIVVRIVLSSGIDPADYPLFQALFGMIFTSPSSRSEKQRAVGRAVQQEQARNRAADLVPTIKELPRGGL